ncbi:MAG: cysteine desulfurase [Anaerolineae bacterium]|nr:cysteine desulfurase [Anaerolineae bacterium]
MGITISNNPQRQDFPILSRKISDNVSLVYLDSAATSQKPNQVISAMDAYYRNNNANIHRGIHVLAEEATAEYERAREKIANFIGVKNVKQIVFTKNTTESINLVAYSWGRKNLKTSDHIILTEMEHHSNLVPWYILAEELGFQIDFVPFDREGMLDIDQYQRLLENKPKLVAFTHMSNVFGTINPVGEMVKLAHAAGAVALVDGAQSIPHFPVNVSELNIDFLAFSGHKMCGPTGIGVLYGKIELLDSMPPFLGGGDMIKKVRLGSFKPNEVPYKFEAGTPPIAEVIGLGAAVDYLETIGMKNVFRHEQELTAYGFDGLSKIQGVSVIGPAVDKRGGVLSFVMEGVHPHDVSQVLDQDGVAVRAGHHCAMPLHEKLGIPASTRASLYLYNDKSDLDKLFFAVERVKSIFG